MKRNNKSVLVVDDNTDSRRAVSARLISAGYKVYGVANALDALEQLRKNSVDVVLTVLMPAMDSLEFLAVCRVKWPGTPVVVVSGDQDDLANEAVEQGASAWVRKGCEFTLLLQILALVTPQSVPA